MVIVISVLPDLAKRRDMGHPALQEVGDQRLFGDAPPEPGLEALKKSWPEVWSGLREWLELLPEAELGSELSYHVASMILTSVAKASRLGIDSQR